jgi:hypothetical protein
VRQALYAALISANPHVQSHWRKAYVSNPSVSITAVLTVTAAFACDVEGCGRHFSVVSNLRRHKKVHKGEKEGASGEDEE